MRRGRRVWLKRGSGHRGTKRPTKRLGLGDLFYLVATNMHLVTTWHQRLADKQRRAGAPTERARRARRRQHRIDQFKPDAPTPPPTPKKHAALGFLDE